MSIRFSIKTFFALIILSISTVTSQSVIADSNVAGLPLPEQTDACETQGAEKMGLFKGSAHELATNNIPDCTDTGVSEKEITADGLMLSRVRADLSDLTLVGEANQVLIDNGWRLVTSSPGWPGLLVFSIPLQKDTHGVDQIIQNMIATGIFFDVSPAYVVGVD